MRLLQLQGGGSFSLVEFQGNNIPPYAILSHTWGPNDEEVIYQDVLSGTGRGKSGYHKLTFCAKQAAKDGLQYIWIDTCCINKDSSAELSEAINSMFRWYYEAVKCYVFLSDVSTAGSAGTSVTFPETRWFTRGWTLQELLAPARVEFFSREGDLLGDKHSRVQEISEITNIATEALEGEVMSSFCVKERMLWASRRETTRKEDKAYSLLGIFDVFMSPIYGEGEEHALKRLLREIFRNSEDDLQQLNSAILVDATYGLNPSEARTLIVILKKYRSSILTLPVELDGDSLNMDPTRNQNQYGTRYSDTISTKTENKLSSKLANGRDCERTTNSPLELSLESDRGTEELVCDTSPSSRSC
jgi:hypothetical protein